MKTLMFLGVRKLGWKDVEEPRLQGPGQALVRPIAAARCDLDAMWMTQPSGPALRAAYRLHLCDESHLAFVGDPAYAPPFPVGHECVAEVVAVGESVKSVRPGQRVIVPFQVACGHCGPCRMGIHSRCTSNALCINTYGFGPGAKVYGGVVADLVLVPYADAMLVPLPDGLDPAAMASMSDNVPDGWQGVGPALLERPGSDVLVVGGHASSVGLYTVAIALAMGANSVDYADADRERLELAERLGARPLEIHRKFWGLGRYKVDLPRRYPIAVDACSDLGARGLELALRSLEVGGRCTALGIYHGKRTPLPLAEMFMQGVSFHTGIGNARATIQPVLDLVVSGRLDPSPVTTLLAPWEDAPKAFLEKTTKVIVTRA